MSAILTPRRDQSNRFQRLLTYDYFPQLDPYIQWLRQPIGWFILGAVASSLVGAFLSPLAWSLAAGLVALLLMGVSYPWICMRGTKCEVACDWQELEEGQSPSITVTVHNYCPWPICGLVVEGLLATPLPLDSEETTHNGNVALSAIPWFSSATYRVTLETQYRGRFPLRTPTVSCAFPLAIWTARKLVDRADPIVVRPQNIKLCGPAQLSGNHAHHCGDGTRPGGNSDFIGLRGYRPGDSIRNIHWAHTARTGSIVVCQRGAAQRAQWSIVLDASCQDHSRWSRDNLAWRVRVAASLCRALHHQQIPFQLDIPGEDQWLDQQPSLSSASPLQSVLDRLTDVPLDGLVPQKGNEIKPSILSAGASRSALHECTIRIEPVHADELENRGRPFVTNKIRLSLNQPTDNLRRMGHGYSAIIDLDGEVSEQVTNWLQRSEHGIHAA